jgi:hypothetical protein
MRNMAMFVLVCYYQILFVKAHKEQREFINSKILKL